MPSVDHDPGHPLGHNALARMVAQMPTAVALLAGPDHVYVAASESYFRVAGKPVLGRSYRAAFPELKGQGYLELMDQVYATGEPWSARGVRAAWDADEDGVPEEHFIDVTFAPVRGAGGEVEAVTLTVEVVDGRVQTERELEVERARLEFVFQHAPAFLAVLRGPDHVFELVNDAYLQLVGHRDPVGKPVVEALPEIRGQGFIELLDHVLSTGEPFVGREVPVLLQRTPGAPAEERFLDLTYLPITNVHAEREGIIAHGTDTTDAVLARRQIERLLGESEEARAAAEAANRTKADFLASMSHELRTPINAILGYTELLEDGIVGAVTERQREHLARVAASGRHLLGVVEDILDLAKLEAGRVEVARERHDAHGAVAAAVPLVLPQAQSKGIAVENRCATGCDHRYLGDEDRVRQILVNLLSNAVKFTDPGGHIRIEAEVTAAPDPEARLVGAGPWTAIRVSDTGIGIEPGQLEAMFTPFVQAESGHTRTRGGTGLGLTISREFARIMGGDLTARSVPGEGSTFTVWLPCDAADAPADSVSDLTRGGEAIQADVERIVSAYVARLRDDAAVPMARDAARVELEDHVSVFLADIAQSLVIQGETTGGRQLMRDNSDVCRLISDRHGGQRARLGWTEEALRREYRILGEEVEAALRRVSAPGADRPLSAVRELLADAERISLVGFRDADFGDGGARDAIDAAQRKTQGVANAGRGRPRGSGADEPP